jgi:hypothetical protein
MSLDNPSDDELTAEVAAFGRAVYRASRPDATRDDLAALAAVIQPGLLRRIIETPDEHPQLIANMRRHADLFPDLEDDLSREAQAAFAEVFPSFLKALIPALEPSASAAAMQRLATDVTTYQLISFLDRPHLVAQQLAENILAHQALFDDAVVHAAQARLSSPD